MSYGKLIDDLEHVNVVTTTPFEDDGEQVRHDHLRENVTVLVEAGIRTFIPCGGAGEILGLSLEERVDVVESTADSVGSDGSVFGGIAGNYKDALRLIERYEAVGADGVMLRPPNQRSKHQRGLLEYYRNLVAATDLGVIVYRRDPVASDAMIAELADLENVLAVKYKDTHESFLTTKHSLPDDVFDELVWLCGTDAELNVLSFWREGATGFTTALGNFVPRFSLSLFGAMKEGDWKRASALRRAARGYLELEAGTGTDNAIPAANSIPALKYGQDLAGMYGGPARQPLVAELSEEDKQRARASFQRLETSIRANE